MSKLEPYLMYGVCRLVRDSYNDCYVGLTPWSQFRITTKEVLMLRGERELEDLIHRRALESLEKYRAAYLHTLPLEKCLPSK